MYIDGRNTQLADDTKAGLKGAGGFDRAALIRTVAWMAVLAGTAYFTTVRPWHYDEIESIHAAWKISSGELIYVDFFEQHQPALYMLIAPVIGVLGDRFVTVQAITWMMVPFSLGLVILSYRIPETVFDKGTARMTIVLLPLVPWFLVSVYEIRPDVPMLFFGLSALYFVYAHENSGGSWRLFIGAASLALASFFTQ